MWSSNRSHQGPQGVICSYCPIAYLIYSATYGNCLEWIELTYQLQWAKPDFQLLLRFLQKLLVFSLSLIQSIYKSHLLNVYRWQNFYNSNSTRMKLNTIALLNRSPSWPRALLHSPSPLKFLGSLYVIEHFFILTYIDKTFKSYASTFILNYFQ